MLPEKPDVTPNHSPAPYQMGHQAVSLMKANIAGCSGASGSCTPRPPKGVSIKAKWSVKSSGVASHVKEERTRPVEVYNYADGR